MKTRFKKISAMFLAAAMTASMTGVTVFAETTDSTAQESTDASVSDSSTITFDADSIHNTTGMFRVIHAVLSQENGQNYLTVTLSGSGYHNLFKGTYEDAVAAGTKIESNASWINGTKNDAGKWEFKIPITSQEAAGEQDIAVTAVSYSRYTNYKNGTDELNRCFYPRQIRLNRTDNTLTAGDYDHETKLTLNQGDGMFEPASARLETVGGPNSNGYKEILKLQMKNDTYEEAFIGTAADAEKAGTAEKFSLDTSDVFAITLRQNQIGGGIVYDYLEKPVVISFRSASGKWYEQTMTVSKTGQELTFGESKNITSIALDKDQISLEAGSRATLRASVSPSDASGKNLTWTSADEKIAKVSDGEITGVSEGETTVTASSADGSIKATCKVTVTPAAEKKSFDATVTAGSDQYALHDAYVTEQTDGTYILKGYYLAEGTAAANRRNIIALGTASDARDGKADLYQAKLVKTGDQYRYYFTIPVQKLGEEFTVSFSRDGIDETAIDGLQSGMWDQTTFKVDADTSQTADETALTGNDLHTYVPVTNIVIRKDGSDDVFAEVKNPKTGIPKMGSLSGVEPGSTYHLSAYVEPANATNADKLTWTLSDATKRRVKNNELSVDKNGTVRISKNVKKTMGGLQLQATIPGASNAWKATVNVMIRAIPATSITLDETELNLNAGSEKTLTPTLTPANCTTPASDISWTSSDENVATVDKNGKVTAVNTGKATITAEVDGQKTACNVTVSGEAALPSDGEYDVSLTSSLGMFHFENPVKATVNGKSTTLHIVSTTSRARFDRMYLGKYQEKSEDMDAAAIVGTPDKDPVEDGTKYAFDVTVPTSSLAKGNRIYYVVRYRENYNAGHSGDWFEASSGDYYFTVNGFSSLSADPVTPSDPAAPSGSDVNNSTTLADGTYTPDGFTFSGGSGKASITCPQVTVSGGKSYAKIVFSSNKYTTVWVNGQQYDAVSEGGGSAFIIPVSLNTPQTITARTTAMSQPHDIDYQITVSLSDKSGDHPENPQKPSNPEKPEKPSKPATGKLKAPVTPKIRKAVSRKKGTITVTWKKGGGRTKGYQIRYSRNKNMKKAKVVTIRKRSTTKKTITKLKAGKKYYIQVRAFNKKNGQKAYSKWSGKKSVKVSKKKNSGSVTVIQYNKKR